MDFLLLMSPQGNRKHNLLRKSPKEYTVIEAFFEVMLAANTKALHSAISERW